jgi:peptide/nickel transport system permease protein
MSVDTNEKEIPKMTELQITLQAIKQSKIALVSIGIVITFLLLGLFAPILAPYDPTEMHGQDTFESVSRNYLLGTDHLGRDTLSRTLYGARSSMYASLLVVSVTVVIGVPIGAISGYTGGKVDEVLMRTTDIIMSFPGITLALLIAFMLGRGLMSAALALSLIGWTTMARIVRSVVLSEKERDYVVAARVMGKSPFAILFREILPNSIYPVIIDAVMRMGTTIIALAGLSFIGVGVQPPNPDWGIMISSGRKYLLDYPMLSILPGVLIIIVVLAYNMIGDRLRDALDPKLRRELVGIAEA